jgi:disulfide bond formation protein DsbB
MVILSVGILRKDKGVALYILPFSIAGSLIALYQTFLQWGWIPEKILACSADSVSCATKQFDFFGFITIPFLSLLAFLLITGLVWVYHLRSHE